MRKIVVVGLAGLLGACGGTQGEGSDVDLNRAPSPSNPSELTQSLYNEASLKTLSAADRAYVKGHALGVYLYGKALPKTVQTSRFFYKPGQSAERARVPYQWAAVMASPSGGADGCGNPFEEGSPTGGSNGGPGSGSGNGSGNGSGSGSGAGAGGEGGGIFGQNPFEELPGSGGSNGGSTAGGSGSGSGNGSSSGGGSTAGGSGDGGGIFGNNPFEEIAGSGGNNGGSSAGGSGSGSGSGNGGGLFEEIPGYGTPPGSGNNAGSADAGTTNPDLGTQVLYLTACEEGPNPNGEGNTPDGGTGSGGPNDPSHPDNPDGEGEGEPGGSGSSCPEKPVQLNKDCEEFLDPAAWSAREGAELVDARKMIDAQNPERVTEAELSRFRQGLKESLHLEDKEEDTKYSEPEHMKKVVRSCGMCTHSPLVLDLNGDGVQASRPEEGVPFDLLETGRPVLTAWPWGDDALLVLDRNGDGLINDGGELFGSSLMADGRTFPNGFASLAELDKKANGGNGDGHLDRRDKKFRELRLWKDLNRDGVSTREELTSLTKARIVKLSLRYTMLRSHDRAGNALRERGSFWRKGSDGKLQQGDVIDVWFRTRPMNVEGVSGPVASVSAPSAQVCR